MKTKILLLITLGFNYLFTATWAHARQDIGAYFEGERLEYNISFWFLEKAAFGYMEFKKIQEKPLRYQAVLYTETRGASKVLTFYQRHIYRSVMEVVEAEGKLRSLSFEKQILRHGWSEKHLHEFDYHKKIYKRTLYQYGRLVEYKETPIPANTTYEDALSVFYNLRYGAYGEPKQGRILLLPTYPTDGLDFFKIKVATTEEESRERKRYSIPEGTWLTMVEIPPELLDTGGGAVNVWVSPDLIPSVITVEKVLLFGYVKGTFISRSFNNPSAAKGKIK